MKQNKKIKLLEIGCGQGISLLELAKKFPRNLELHGLNLNKKHGIKRRRDLQTNATKAGISIPADKDLPFIHFGDATQMRFKDASFDIVISQVTFIHIKKKARAIEEVYRVLKKDGVALIALGPYSIRRKTGHALPKFYIKLNKKLKRDYNPRFLIKSGKDYVKFTTFIKGLSKSYAIKLWTNNFVSESQRARGDWLIIRKTQGKNELNLNLRYQKKLSEDLTSLYAKNNPVNWGCIDVYKLT